MRVLSCSRRWRRGVRTVPPRRRCVGGEVSVDDRLPAVERVEARSVVVLQLEQLEELGTLGGGRHEMRAFLGVGEQDAYGGVAGEPGDAVGEHLQEFDQVELVDERVGDLDEDFRQAFRRYGGHGCLPAFRPGDGCSRVITF